MIFDKKSSNTYDPDFLVRVFVGFSIAIMVVVLISLLLFVINIDMNSVERQRTTALRQATCEKNQMMLLEDKYHPAVCAFKLDENGNRLPSDR